jgi:hypothetical protein
LEIQQKSNTQPIYIYSYNQTYFFYLDVYPNCPEWFRTQMDIS